MPWYIAHMSITSSTDSSDCLAPVLPSTRAEYLLTRTEAELICALRELEERIRQLDLRAQRSRNNWMILLVMRGFEHDAKNVRDELDRRVNSASI